MALEYIEATIEDIDRLIDARMRVMHEVWGLPDDTDMSEYKQQTRDYLNTALPSGDYAACLVESVGEFVGCAGISYYRVMPTYENPTGRKAYVMNMYVCPEYRRRGIASRMLRFLLDDAQDRNIDFIALEASEEGRPFYEAYGFQTMPDEMLLRLNTQP